MHGFLTLWRLIGGQPVRSPLRSPARRLSVPPGLYLRLHGLISNGHGMRVDPGPGSSSVLPVHPATGGRGRRTGSGRAMGAEAAVVLVEAGTGIGAHKVGVESHEVTLSTSHIF